MPSTYTTNLGIEKIESGAQTGVWGTTTNTNLDIIDQAVNGVHVETLAVPGNSSSPNTLPISDGATSTGRNKYIEFADGGDLGATAYVQLTPNDAEKIVFMRNSLSGGRSVIVFQGTYNASNDFEIPNGKDVVLKFDGNGVGAVVTNVFGDLLAQGVDITTLNLGGTAVTSTAAELNILDGVTATTTELNYVDGVTSNIQTQLDAKSPIASPTFTGTVTIPTADINGGAIDGTTIGTTTPSPVTGTSVTANTSLTVAGYTVTSILDEDNMASDSATALATQQSIKAYVDGSTPDFTSIGSNVSPATDNANDLGSASKRWKDLYLSGGLYIGGTTSANYLSDYEEGTFTLTPIFSAAIIGTIASTYGSYTKVGRKVYLYGVLKGTSNIYIDSGTSIGYAIFGGAPFYGSSDGPEANDTTHGSGGDSTTYGFTTNKTAFMPCAFYNIDWSWGATNGITGTTVLSANITYHTDGTSPP